MVITGILALVLFVSFTFLFHWMIKGYSKKEVGHKQWAQWNTQTFHWQGAIFAGTGTTLLIIFLMKWAGILPL